MADEVDIAHLNLLRDRGGDIGKVLKYLGTHKGSDDIIIDEIIRIIYGDRKVNSKERQACVDIIKELKDLGCGNYVKGRRTSSTRLELSQPMKAYLWNGHTPSSPNEIPPNEDKIPTKRHRLWLREDFCVEVDLPRDITDDEDSRLAKFLEAVPFHTAAKGQP